MTLAFGGSCRGGCGKGGGMFQWLRGWVRAGAVGGGRSVASWLSVGEQVKGG